VNERSVLPKALRREYSPGVRQPLVHRPAHFSGGSL
jgi:hypothetical protein